MAATRAARQRQLPANITQLSSDISLQVVEHLVRDGARDTLVSLSRANRLRKPGREGAARDHRARLGWEGRESRGECEVESEIAGGQVSVTTGTTRFIHRLTLASFLVLNAKGKARSWSSWRS
jgi:hypothetical protein